MKEAGIDGHAAAYMAPEALPRIRSEQTKAILRVLVDAIN